jgi:hypothetical protein
MKVSFLEVRQRESQLVAGAVDIGLHCAEWKIEDFGNLFVRPALHMTEQDAGAVLRT